MNKNLRNGLFLVLAFLIVQILPAQNFCESNASGEVQTTSIWTCHGTATPPTISSFVGDSIVVKHTVYWGTSQNQIIDWSSSNMKLLRVRSGGKIGPNVNNNELIIPATAVIRIDAGASISPLSGNNSNHAVNIGGVCIWGKKCCGGNQTIFGPILMTSAFPCGFIALPVELISFTGVQENDVRLFTWVTASENNVSRFTIDETIDGVNWQTVGIINSKGNSNEPRTYKYMLSYFAPSTSASYRLSETNFAGETNVLKTISLSAKTGATVVTQTPGGLNVTVAPEVETVTISICDLYGKQIYTQAGIANNGNINVQLTNYTAGMYIVNLVNAADQSVISTQKILLQ